MCAFFVIRNVLEIICGGDRSPSPGDRDQSTDASCSAADKTDDCASMNGCGAELSSGTEEKNNHEEEEAASLDSGQDNTAYTTETDRLAVCRMILLEDMAAPSSDDSTACPNFSVIRSDDPSASTSALIIDFESSSSTTDPDTASKDVTATETDTISSKDDNFPATIIAPWPDTKSGSTESTDIVTSGSKLHGDAEKDSSDESLICFEPDVVSSLLPAGAVAQSKSSTVQYSIWNSDRQTGRTDDGLSGSAYKDLEVGSTTCGVTKRSEDLSIASDAASLNVEGHLLKVEKLVCNGNQMQHADGTTDSTYGDTTHKHLGEETVICSEAKTSICVTPSTLSCAVSCGRNIQSQSSTVEYAFCSDDRHSEATVKDRSGCENICNTNIPWPTDGSLEVETKSASTCGTPRGTAPWSLRSHSGCGSRMKGLRIPLSTTSSAGKSNGSITMTTSQDVRPCVDMPLIAGITARRIGDSTTPGVLPATLLPRPFMSRSCYRSIRPFCSTTSAVRGTENNADGGNLTERAGNGLPPPIVGVRESATTTAVVTGQPTSSFNHKFTIGEVEPICTASSAVQEPEDQTHNRIMAAKALTPPTNGVVASTTVGATEKVVHPACPPTTNCRQQLMSNEVHVSKNFQGIHVSTNMNTYSEPSSSINGCKTLLENHSITPSHQKPNSTEVIDSKSLQDAFASPNLITPGQPVLINDSQQPAYKLLRPPTMPKPTRPAPSPAIRVSDPLPPSPSSPRHSVTQDDDRTISSADLAVRSRTTPDGGSDSMDQRETTTSTTSSDATSMTATADSNTTTTSFHLDRYLPPGNQSITTLHKEEVIAHPIIIEKKERPATTTRRRESDGMEETALEKVGMNGTVLGTVNNGWKNSVDHSNAAQLGTSSVSAKLSVEEQRKPEDPREASASSDGRPELTRRTTVECIEDASKYVEESSHQLTTEIISLEKGVFGLGFCIEGGRDCPTGRAPVTVKRIFRGELISKFFFMNLTCSLR